MYNLKKMLSNDSIANDVSNDLIRKTPSSRKLRVPAQGKVMERKCVVKMANGKEEFRTGFMVSPSPLIVCLWEYREDNRDVQIHKYLRDSWAAKIPRAVFWGYWGPKKTYPAFKYFKCIGIFMIFPFSPAGIKMQSCAKLNLCLSFAVLLIASAFHMSF